MKHSSYSKILLLLYKLCISIFILGRIRCTDGSNYHENEVAALLTWKSNIEKDSQVILSSWVSDNHLCINWSGIICNEGGRVSSLNLSDYGIRGTLHDLNLSCFTEIMSIDISYNFSFGMVSPKLSNLSRLTYLNLGFNHFAGNIPPQIGLLENLRVLNMNRNIMNGSIPQGIGKMRYLNHLDLGSNALTGSIPDSFAILNNLEIMDLSCNNLSGKIPTRLGMLQSVVKLNLSHNNLSGPVPSSFKYCFSLTSIDISFNQLKGPLSGLNVHSSFVSNNSGLCGGILGLKPCFSDTFIGGGTGGKSIAEIVLLACTIGITIGIIVTAAVFLGSFLFGRKVRYQKEIDDFVLDYYTRSFIRCTYILEATERFSSKYHIAVGRSAIVYKTELGDGGLAVKQFNATKDPVLVSILAPL
ncbi:hypothetical protein LIER_02176 [Lithospermum erythrorhizon]|uniref:Leucine-rich repeat-containing N-terminal plant-type domain-containing protein n=1 Tax=Lithospermum erythrorhizon TaxID=34254 RepID=A0AAV3NT19_LITER